MELKKRILGILLAAVMIITYMPALALASEADSGLDPVLITASGTCGDGVEWTLDNEGTLTISGNGTITESGFRDYKDSIKKIVIREGVTNAAFFEGFQNLESFQAYNGLEVIEDYAFWGCAKLTDVALATSLKTIRHWAFTECRALKKVYIPKNVTGIGQGAFAGCTSLESIVVTADNNSFSSKDGVLYDYNKTKLYCWPPAKEGEAKIPETVKHIEDTAFALCNQIKEIMLPDGLETIGFESFYVCKNLSRVFIPESLSYIGYEAFAGAGIEVVFYEGSKEQWDSIQIQGANDSLTSAQIKYNSNNELNFSKDVWNFRNYTDSFCHRDATAYYGLSPSSRAVVTDYLNKGSEGHCFGMSSMVILNKIGAEDFAKYARVKYLRDAEKASIDSLICIYHAVQHLRDYQKEAKEFLALPEAKKIEELVKKVKRVKEGRYPVLLIVSNDKEDTSHALVAYALEEGQFISSTSNKTYDSRILLYDCNAVDWKENNCFLFNKGSSDWEIPHYYGSYDSYSGGYLQSASDTTASYDLIDDYVKTKDYSSELRVNIGSPMIITNNETNEQWMIDAAGHISGAQDLTVYYDCNDDTDSISSSMVHIILPEGAAAYSVNFQSGAAEPIDAHILTGDKYLAVSSVSAKGAVLSPDGVATLKGNTGAYHITAVDDNNEKAGQFDTYRVSGENPGETSLCITDAGARIEGDSIKGATLEASNATDVSTVKVNADKSAEYGNKVRDYGKDHVHLWESSRSVDKKATYASVGSKSIHCTVCNAVKPGTAVSIPKLKVKKTALVKVVPAKRGFKAKWKKISGVTGYELQYARNSKFTKGKKTVKIKKASTTSRKVSKLKAKKKYYVRIRAYKVYKGKKYYSGWSKKKAVTAKK